jgi:hypothetical protein
MMFLELLYDKKEKVIKRQNGKKADRHDVFFRDYYQ